MRCDLLRTIKERQEQLQGLELRCTANSVCRWLKRIVMGNVYLCIYRSEDTENKCLGKTNMLRKF